MFIREAIEDIARKQCKQPPPKGANVKFLTGANLNINATAKGAVELVRREGGVLTATQGTVDAVAPALLAHDRRIQWQGGAKKEADAFFHRGFNIFYKPAAHQCHLRQEPLLDSRMQKSAAPKPALQSLFAA